MRGDTYAERDEAEYYSVYVRVYTDEVTWDCVDEQDFINYPGAYQFAEMLADKYGCDIDEY